MVIFLEGRGCVNKISFFRMKNSGSRWLWVAGSLVLARAV